MALIEKIVANLEEMTATRHDFHAHPELGFQEVRTSGIVAEKLKSWGIEVHTGIGGTGVIGIIEGKGAGKTIGLRADMDALPIHEQTNLPYSSTNAGVMHACGHDGHTTMLLGAAKYLAETRDFNGTAVMIFQPAEEGLGGAKAMLADNLFDRFPCDEIYGIHNRPNGKPNHIGIKPGVAAAAADFFDIKIKGRGSHAARPQDSHDPVLAAASLVQNMQSIVSRNLDPRETVVLSITRINGGSAYNVIPGETTLAGTVRCFSTEVRNFVGDRIRAMAKGLETSFDVEVEVKIDDVFDVLINDDALTDGFVDIAREVMGEENVEIETVASTGSEDFADMMRVVPGAYFTVGHAGTVSLHNEGFFMDDQMLPVGASLFARIVERRG
jgi:amidohydrolase